VCAALVIGDGVDFVDYNCLNASEILAGLAGREQNVERLRRGDEDVRRMLEHRRAVLLQRVSGANAGADFGTEIATLHGQLLYLRERPVKVLLHVVGERFEWRDVDDVRVRRETAFNGCS